MLEGVFEDVALLLLLLPSAFTDALCPPQADKVFLHLLPQWLQALLLLSACLPQLLLELMPFLHQLLDLFLPPPFCFGPDLCFPATTLNLPLHSLYRMSPKQFSLVSTWPRSEAPRMTLRSSSSFCQTATLFAFGHLTGCLCPGSFLSVLRPGSWFMGSAGVLGFVGVLGVFSLVPLRALLSPPLAFPKRRWIPQHCG